jgi:hypothetical protein
MPRPSFRFALLISVLFAAPPLAAQGAGVTGTWITEFDRMMRNENGSVTTGEKTRARLVLEQSGDSVAGTLQILGDGGTPPPPRQLRGTIAGDRVKLTAQFDARVNRNGEESTRTITVVYDLTVKGDTLEGTMTNRSGDMDMPPRPFTATREKR